MRPADLPAAEAYAHGTRARYVTGCRCRPCKDANLAYYHQRKQRAAAQASEVEPSGPPLAGELVRGGRVYRVQRCPGANGERCVVPGGAWLIRGGPVCAECLVRATVWNGLVSAGRVRQHLRRLRAAGVGRDTVADISGIGATTIDEIRSGRARRIRRSTERAILKVTKDAMTEAKLVPASQVWDQIEKLIRDDGFTKAEIARRLGLKTAALQFKKTRMTARTVARFERFVRRLNLGA